MSSTATIEQPQHMVALARANEVRAGHQALKTEIRTGATSVADALDDPRAKGNLTVCSLLMAQRRWAIKKAAAFLRALGISQNRRVDQLTERQKAEVARAFRA